MLMRRFAAGPLAVLLGFALLAPAQEGPTDADISKWVQELGHTRFAKRQEAIKKLWEAGGKAEPALREAAKSRDAEISKAAKELLERIDWGILHDSSPAILKEINRFKSGIGGPDSKEATGFDMRREAIGNLMKMEPLPFHTIRKLLEKPSEELEHVDNYSRLSAILQMKVADWWQAGRRSDIDALCDFILSGPDVSFARPYAAYMQLTGRLKEALDRWQSEKLAEPLRKNRDMVLVHLFRLAGDRTKSQEAAKRVGDPLFAYQANLAMQSWKELDGPLKEVLGDANPGFSAMVARLAGNEKGLAERIKSLKETAEDGETTPGALRNACIALMLAGYAKEGLEPLLRRKRSLVLAFDGLVAQAKYKEALDLAAGVKKRDTPDEENADLFELELRRARLLSQLGERESAVQAARALADRQLLSNNNQLQNGPIRRMTEAGFRDIALEWGCASIKANDGTGGPLAENVLKELNPGREFAFNWVHAYRQATGEADHAKVLRSCVRLLDGKAEPAERAKVMAWIAGELKDHQDPADPMYQSLPAVEAELLVAEGKRAEAIELLEKAVKRKDSAELRHDLIELRMRSQPADEARRKALFADAEALRKLDDDSGLPLMAEFAEPERKAELEFLARLATLSDTTRRQSVLRTLTKLGLTERAAGQAELAAAHGWPSVGGFEYADVLERLAIQRVRQRKFNGVADISELFLLICAMSDAQFTTGSAYWTLPQLARLRRGYELLHAGKADEAVPILRKYLELVPEDISAVIVAWPELMKQGKKPEAEALYKIVHDSLEGNLKRYPKYSNGWNSAAWMEINSRMDPKAALEHATMATELDPKNASYRDTLAECHFVLGNKVKAIELTKRNIEQEPLRSYFRRQLERFRTKDPATSWPEEEEE